MAGIAGSHADSLANPVPGAQPDASLAIPSGSKMPSFDAPAPPQDSAPTQAAPAEQDPLAVLAAEHGGGSQSNSSADPLAQLAAEHSQPASSEPGFLSDLKAGAQSSFAHTDKQKKAVLENTYGADKVRKTGDEWQYKKDGDWHNAERGFFQAYKDIIGAVVPGLQGRVGEGLPGLAKDIAGSANAAIRESVAAIPETAAAVVSGGELLSGAGAVAIPATMATGRVAGGIAGNAAADWVGSKIGVPEDASDNKLIRYGVDAVTRTIVGFGADKLLGWAKGKLAERAAGYAEKKAALEALPETSVANMTKDIAETGATLDKLKSDGIIDPNFKLRPDQMTHEPNLAAIAQQASKSRTFQDLAEEQGKAMADVWTKLDQGASKLGGSDNFGNKTISKLSSSDKAFGSLLGEMRDRIATSPEGKEGIPVPLVGKMLGELDNLGFKKTSSQYDNGLLQFVDKPDPIGSGLESPTAEVLASKLELSGPNRLGDAGEIIKLVNRVNDSIANNAGKLPANVANRLYSELTSRINLRVGDSSSIGYTRTLIKLKDAVRDDLAEGMGNVLGDSASAQYGTAMSRYRMFRQAEDSLGSLLDQPGVTTDQFVKHVFTPGPKGFERISQMKRILDATDPEAFQQLKGHWFQQLADASPLQGAKSDRLGNIDFKKFSSQIEKLGDDNLRQLFDSKELASLRDYLKIGQQMQKADFAYLPQESPDKTLAAKLLRTVNTVGHFIGYHRAGPSRINADAANLVLHIAPDDLALKYLTSGGVEDIMKLVPSVRQTEVRSRLNKIVDVGLKASQNIATPLPGMQTAPAAIGISQSAGSYIGNKNSQQQSSH